MLCLTSSRNRIWLNVLQRFDFGRSYGRDILVSHTHASSIISSNEKRNILKVYNRRWKFLKVKIQKNRTLIQLYTCYVNIYFCRSCRFSYLKLVLFISFWLGRGKLAVVVWSGCSTRHHSTCYWSMSSLLLCFLWIVSDFYLLYTLTPL